MDDRAYRQLGIDPTGMTRAQRRQARKFVARVLAKRGRPIHWRLTGHQVTNEARALVAGVKR